MSQALQKLKRWITQLLEHERCLWLIPLVFVLLLSMDLMILFGSLI